MTYFLGRVHFIGMNSFAWHVYLVEPGSRVISLTLSFGEHFLSQFF